MKPKERQILAVCASLLFVLLALLAFSRLSTGFDFSWLTRQLFGISRPARSLPPTVSITAFTGGFDDTGRYRFSGRLTAITDKAVLDPVLSVEIYDADNGRYLDRDQLQLATIEPGRTLEFGGSLPVTRRVGRLRVVVEVQNHPFITAENLALSAGRAQ